MSGFFFNSNLSFPRRRESRDIFRKKLDARLRGHDGRNSPIIKLIFYNYYKFPSRISCMSVGVKAQRFRVPWFKGSKLKRVL
jgi:hypothetical protein